MYAQDVRSVTAIIQEIGAMCAPLSLGWCPHAQIPNETGLSLASGAKLLFLLKNGPEGAIFEEIKKISPAGKRKPCLCMLARRLLIHIVMGLDAPNL